MEHKYGFKFKDYYKRVDALKQWEKEIDPLSLVQKRDTKKPKLRTIKESDWMNSDKRELSSAEALERFYKIKAEEKKQRLLEELRNIDLLQQVRINDLDFYDSSNFIDNMDNL